MANGNRTDQLSNVFLGTFGRGMGLGERSFQTSQERQFRDRQFQAQQAARQFRQDIATAQEGRAQAEFEAGAPARQLSQQLASGRLQQVPDILSAEAKTREMGLEGGALDLEAKRTQIQSSRELIRTRRFQRAAARRAEKRAAALAQDKRNYQNTLAAGGFAVSPEGAMDDPTRLLNIARIGLENGTLGQAEFKAIRQGVNKMNAAKLRFDQLDKKLKDIKKDLGPDDLSKAAATWIAQSDLAKAALEKAGFNTGEMSDRARRMSMLAAELITDARAKLKSEPNNQRVQLMLDLATNIGTLTKDEDIEDIRENLRQQYNVMIAEMAAPSLGAGFIRMGGGVRGQQSLLEQAGGTPVE